MSFIEHPFTPLFLFAAFLVAASGISLLMRYRTPLARWGGILMLAIGIDLLSYFLVLTGAFSDAYQFNFQILVFTYLILVTAWIFFIFVFCGHEDWVNWRSAILFGTIPIIMGVQVLTRPGIDPLWISNGTETIGSLMVLTREFGWFGNLFIAYTFGLGFLSTGLLLQILPNTNHYFRIPTIVLFIGSLSVVILGLLELTDHNPFAPIASIQLGYAISSILAFLFVFGLRAGGTLPVARNAAFDNIQDGVLVLDQQDNLMDLNIAASQIIGKADKSVLGKPVSNVWAQGAKILETQSDGEYILQTNGFELTYDVKISPVLNTKQEKIGRIVVLRNVTGRERMEKALQEHTRELARTNSLITALSTIASQLGTTADTDLLFETLGTEIRKLGLNCGIVTIDPIGETATIKFVSLGHVLIQVFKKMTGFSLINHVIPKRYWPGDRIFYMSNPIWYSNPIAILQRLFPQVPDVVAKKLGQSLGIQSIGQICILPLRVGDKLIGAMPIWGTDLQQEDNPALTIFASQVAVILQNTITREYEAERTNELTRSNSMILALSKVAAQLENSSDSAEIYKVVGMELKKMGMDSVISILDNDKQNLLIKYMSVSQNVIRWAEKMSGYSLGDLTIPRRLWPSEKVVNEKTAYWDPNSMKGTLDMFPILPKGLHKTALKMAGIDVNDPVCYLPLANEHDVIGVLAVWGAGLKRNDVSALSVLASQVTTAIRNSILFENESRRAVELSLLLEASEAVSLSSKLSDVLLSLASKLLDLSGFETCYISEWDKDTNKITGLIEHTHVFWRKEKRVAYSLSDYPLSKKVLLTGIPMILQGEFEAEEKQWMDELGRTGLLSLALKAGTKNIGLVEIAMTEEKHLFEPHVLQECQEILENAADLLVMPLSQNNPKILYELEDALMKASGGEICSFSEWDQAADQILTVAVSTNLSWTGQSTKRPVEDPARKKALLEGKASYWIRSDENEKVEFEDDSSMSEGAESIVILPLQRGNESFGLIELYDYNHKTLVTGDRIALLRTVADKAGFSIQNASLLQQTQMRLNEKTALLNEKEVLLKEVHHRVKNNLQIISSLLNLQSAKISEPETKDVLRESQNRVRTMALIHEKLYQSTDLAQIDFSTYLPSLVNFLLQSYRGKSENVAIQVSAQNILVDLETAIPCGLIINELVSNSLKYAFPDKQQGNINITCHQTTSDVYNIIVSDDGVGLPTGFDISLSQSLGLKLVLNLVNQLRGKLDIKCDKGTTFQVSFKK